MSVRIAYGTARIGGGAEVAADELREEPVGPVGVRAVARCVELFDVAPHASAVFQNRHFEARHALAGDVRDVLGVVQERYVVVVAAEQQDLAAEIQKARERAAVAECVVPRSLLEQASRMLAPSRES